MVRAAGPSGGAAFWEGKEGMAAFGHLRFLDRGGCPKGQAPRTREAAPRGAKEHARGGGGRGNGGGGGARGHPAELCHGAGGAL